MSDERPPEIDFPLTLEDSPQRQKFRITTWPRNRVAEFISDYWLLVRHWYQKRKQENKK